MVLQGKLRNHRQSQMHIYQFCLYLIVRVSVYLCKAAYNGKVETVRLAIRLWEIKVPKKESVYRVMQSQSEK